MPPSELVRFRAGCSTRGPCGDREMPATTTLRVFRSITFFEDFADRRSRDASSPRTSCRQESARIRIVQRPQSIFGEVRRRMDRHAAGVEPASDRSERPIGIGRVYGSWSTREPAEMNHRRSASHRGGVTMRSPGFWTDVTSTDPIPIMMPHRLPIEWAKHRSGRPSGTRRVGMENTDSSCGRDGFRSPSIPARVPSSVPRLARPSSSASSSFSNGSPRPTVRGCSSLD